MGKKVLVDLELLEKLIVSKLATFNEQVRFMGFTAPMPSSGAGVEVYYFSDGRGYVIAYDRGTAAWKDLRLYGQVVEMYAAGTLRLTVNANGITVAGSVSDTDGNVRDIPPTTRNSTTAFSAADRGKTIVKDNTTAYTWAVNTGVFTAGMAITVINDGTAGDVTISQGSGMTLISGTTTGNFTLAPGQSRTLLALSSTRVRVL